MKKFLLILTVFTGLLTQAQTPVYPYSDGGKWGLTNENLEILVQPQFDTSFYFLPNSTAIVQKNKKFGSIDKTGKIIIPISYEQLSTVSDNVAIGRVNAKYAFVDFKTGKQLSPTLFDKINGSCFCRENIVAVEQNKKHGFVNANTGKAIGQIRYDAANFMEIALRGKVKSGNKYGVIDLRNGTMILPLKYERIELDYEGANRVISTLLSGQKKIYDQNGKEIAQERPQISTISQEGIKDEGMSIVEAPVVDGAFGTSKDLYIYNQGNGNWKLSLEKRGYNSTEVYETFELKGYSALQKLSYNSYDQKRPAKIKAVKDGKTGIIDMSGNILVPFAYDDIEFNYQHYKTRKDNKVGMLNLEMVEVKKPVLKNILRYDYMYDAWVIEMPAGQKGYMNSRTGKIYIPGISE